jgi:hypothetical protein
MYLFGQKMGSATLWVFLPPGANPTTLEFFYIKKYFFFAVKML